MKVDFIGKEKNVEKFLIHFDESEVKEEERKVVQKFKKNADIPGFRKGKVPESIIIARIGKENIKYFVEDALISKAAREISKNKDLLISPIVKASEFEDNTLKLEIELHLEPDLELPNYEGMEIELKLAKKTLDKYVNERLKALAYENSITKPKEGKIEYGDLVKLEYTVKNQNGETIYKSKELEVEIDENDKRPIVTEIVGSKAGDMIKFERKFEGKNGVEKIYEYTVNVKNVYERFIPEINDEFAKNLEGDYKNLEELKESIRNEMKDIEGMKSNDSSKVYLMEYVFNELLNKVKVDVSDETVEFIVEDMINEMKKKGRYKEFKASFEDEEKMKEMMKSTVLTNMKEKRFVDYVIKKENLKFENEDYEFMIDKIAYDRGISRERASALLKKDENLRENMMDMIMKRKVKEILLNKVKLKIVEFEEEREEEKDEG